MPPTLAGAMKQNKLASAISPRFTSFAIPCLPQSSCIACTLLQKNRG